MGLVRGLGIRVSDLPWRRRLPRMEACLLNSFYVPSFQTCAWVRVQDVNHSRISVH